MLLLFVLFAFSFADPADLVSWPIGVYVGAPYSFNFYSGYVNVGSSKFFYWFAESSRSPKSDPLLIFLNGGPGCSSVAGSLSENGPFVAINNGSQITNRETSWNRLANVLWIESPAGVGMSYAPGMPPNYTYSTDDHQTARNNLLFLQGWYHKFPQVRNKKESVWVFFMLLSFSSKITNFESRGSPMPV
jgi:serine carboxypeptidase-like clade 2